MSEFGLEQLEATAEDTTLRRSTVAARIALFYIRADMIVAATIIAGLPMFYIQADEEVSTCVLDDAPFA